MASLLDFEQYPDYAMKTNKDGERVREPWASGPSPLSMALMAGGFGMMGDGATEWVGGGGRVWDDIGKGGLLGVQAFGQGHRDLQDLRSDYYTQSRAEEDQLIQNQKFINEERDLLKKKEAFPNIISKLRALNNPAITAKLQALLLVGQGDINSAYNAAVNILSTATKAKSGNIEIKDGIIYSDKLGPDGTKIGETFHGQVSTPSKTKLSPFDRINIALKPDGIPLDPGEFQRLRNNHFQKETKYQKKYTSENEEQILRLRPDYLPDVFEYIKEYRPELMSKPDGSLRTRDELKEIYNLSEPPKTIEEVTSGIKKPSSDNVRDLLKISGIKFTDKFLEQQLASGKYDPTKIKFKTWLAYVTQSGLKIPGPAKSYEDTAQVGARLFGYLMSGATVKEEEMTAMRTAFYPIPGDSKADVQRKRKYRRAMVNIFISQLSPQMKKIMENEVEKIEKIASNPVLVTKEIAKPRKKNSKKAPIIKLDSSESIIKLNELWE
jgi:hypothetical protein